MKRRALLILLSSVLLVSVLAAMPFLAACAAQPTGPITLKAVSFLPGHITSVAGMQMFVDRVNERSQGELTIDYLGGPDVMPPPAQVEAVRTGRIDMAIHSVERFADIVPEGFMMHLSELTPMEERENKAYDWLAKYFEEKMNVHYLGRGNTNGGFYVHTLFPVEKVADLAGKQVAARSQCFDFLKAVGATPVDVGTGDWYAAIEQGIVDAYSIPLTSIPAWGLIEISKYTIDQVIYPASNILIMVNLDKWNSLPRKHQKLMDEIMIEIEPLIADLQGKANAGAKEEMQAGGIEFVKLSPAENKKFVDLSFNAPWEVYRTKVSPEVYAEARKLFTK